MPVFEPTTIKLQGDRLVAEGPQSGVQGAGPQSQPRPFPDDPLLWRPDVLQKHAEYVLKVILDKSLERARKEVEVDDFMPMPKALAPESYRRRVEVISDWPLEGILGKTGKSNWMNMVNNGIIGAQRKIELDQNNGTWVLEEAVVDMDTRGNSDTICIRTRFVDLSGATDQEYEDGAPRKSTSLRAVNVILKQDENGRVQAAAPEPVRKPLGRQSLRPTVPPPEK